MCSTRLVVACALLGVAATVSVVLAADSPPEEDKRKPQIEAFLARLTQADAPALAVFVKQNGKIVLEKGYRVREFGSRAANDPEKLPC